MDQEELYRLGVGIVLLNRLGSVFVGQRIDSILEAWQMPQGGIEHGEIPQDAAKRELEEEIGVTEVEVIAESSTWYSYRLPDHMRTSVWDGQYIGQKQKWFVMKFIGQDSSINIQTLHPEFNAWKWVNFESIPQLIVPFKRKLYQDLVSEFTPVIARGS